MNPFLRVQQGGPSVFSSDPAFRAKSNGKTTSQIATEFVDVQRKQGKNPGTIAGLSIKEDKYAKYREQQLSANPDNLLAVPKGKPRRARSSRAKAAVEPSSQ